VQLRTICDLVLHAYLSRVADSVEKRHYMYALCTAAPYAELYFKDVDAFLDELYKFKVFDVHHSVFQPSDIRVLVATQSVDDSALSAYFMDFSSDPERSREFHHEKCWSATFVMTRYMRFLRMLPNSR